MSKDEHIPRYFRGVMPRDYLPERLKPRSLYVINSEESHSIGKHWILLSTMSSCYSAYICSFGQKPIYKHVIDSLRTVNKKVVYNDFKNQGDFSTVCGWHVIWTAGMLSRGHDLLDLMTKFYTNQDYINDHAILEIISCHFKIEELIPVYDWDFVMSIDSMEKGYGKIGAGSSQLNDGLQTMDGKKNTKARARKQKNPQKIIGSEGRTEEKKAKRRSKKAIKKDESRQALKPIKTKNPDTDVSAKIDLIEYVKSFENDLSFHKILRDFEKSLSIFKDDTTIKIIRFLLYLVVKEKKKARRHNYFPCNGCGYP